MPQPVHGLSLDNLSALFQINPRPPPLKRDTAESFRTEHQVPIIKSIDIAIYSALFLILKNKKNIKATTRLNAIPAEPDIYAVSAIGIALRGFPIMRKGVRQVIKLASIMGLCTYQKNTPGALV